LLCAFFKPKQEFFERHKRSVKKVKEALESEGFSCEEGRAGADLLCKSPKDSYLIAVATPLDEHFPYSGFKYALERTLLELKDKEIPNVSALLVINEELKGVALNLESLKEAGEPERGLRFSELCHACERYRSEEGICELVAKALNDSRKGKA
jgi:hypothetical protein